MDVETILHAVWPRLLWANARSRTPGAARRRLIAVFGFALAAACTGCLTPKGFILRGDWSVEMNRLPWMAGHGAEYETCDESGDRDESCDHDHAGPGNERKPPLPLDSSPEEPVAPGLHEPDDDRADASHASAALAPAPRFHPVPTRPVLESRGKRRVAAADIPERGTTDDSTSEAEPLAPLSLGDPRQNRRRPSSSPESRRGELRHRGKVRRGAEPEVQLTSARANASARLASPAPSPKKKVRPAASTKGRARSTKRTRAAE